MMLMMENRNGCAGWFVRDGRLRSGWRVAIYFVLVRILQIIGGIAFGILVGITLWFAWSKPGSSETEIIEQIRTVLTHPFDFPPVALGAQLTNLIIVLGVVWVFRRALDKRSFASLGVQWTAGGWREFFGGFVFVSGAWGLLFALALAFGAVAITGWAWESENELNIFAALVVGLIFNVMVGVAEEVDSRGYVLQNLAQGIRAAPAIFVSAAGFAILHLLNPGAGLASTIGIFFAGIVFALGYYATGRLWFPIGMHAAWNFIEGPVLGFLVSGINMGGVIKLAVTGPEWLMGGAFGPEAGALALGVEIAMIAALGIWARQKGRHDSIR